MLAIQEIHTYYGDSYVLQGISLKIDQGSAIALLGRNGAGKSTTLKSIVSVAPVRSGDITFRGQSIVGMPCEEVARLGIAYVPEERGIIPNLTVRENLRLGILGSGRRHEAAASFAA